MAGLPAQEMAVEGTPTRKAITDAADDHDASLIVIGSRGGSGLGGRQAGSTIARSRHNSSSPC
jgi:nucleotide-binding universal stress UspA family protein